MTPVKVKVDKKSGGWWVPKPKEEATQPAPSERASRPPPTKQKSMSTLVSKHTSTATKEHPRMPVRAKTTLTNVPTRPARSNSVNVKKLPKPPSRSGTMDSTISVKSPETQAAESSSTEPSEFYKISPMSSFSPYLRSHHHHRRSAGMVAKRMWCSRIPYHRTPEGHDHLECHSHHRWQHSCHSRNRRRCGRCHLGVGGCTCSRRCSRRCWKLDQGAAGDETERDPGGHCWSRIKVGDRVLPLLKSLHSMYQLLLRRICIFVFYINSLYSELKKSI